MTPLSVENPSFATLIRIVGPVEGVSPAAGRGAATSTSRLCFRSRAMLSVDDQDSYWLLLCAEAPTTRFMHHTVM